MAIVSQICRRPGARSILADEGPRIYIMTSRPTGIFDKPGAVAQLGERVNGIHEVRGSIPLSSTRKISEFELRISDFETFPEIHSGLRRQHVLECSTSILPHEEKDVNHPTPHNISLYTWQRLHLLHSLFPPTRSICINVQSSSRAERRRSEFPG